MDDTLTRREEARGGVLSIAEALRGVSLGMTALEDGRRLVSDGWGRAEDVKEIAAGGEDEGAGDAEESSTGGASRGGDEGGVVALLDGEERSPAAAKGERSDEVDKPGDKLAGGRRVARGIDENGLRGDEELPGEPKSGY